MSIATRSSLTVVAVAMSLVATTATPAGSREHRQHGGPDCSALTLTIVRIADVPPGVSRRALQEGRLYPPRCR